MSWPAVLAKGPSCPHPVILPYTRFGLIFKHSSGPNPKRSITPGLKPSINPSTLKRSFLISLIVCGFFKSAESDNFDLILHDDGLQHYALKRNYEILMIDSIHLYGNKMLLPSGPLREPLNLAKKRADIEIVTNLNDIKKFENNSLSQYYILTYNKEVEND